MDLRTMGKGPFGYGIIDYFDLNKRAAEPISLEEAREKVGELESTISQLEMERADFSLFKKIVTYFDFNEPSLPALRREKAFYEGIIES